MELGKVAKGAGRLFGWAQVVETAGWIADMARVLDPRRAGRGGRYETFAFAVNRLRLTEADLRAALRARRLEMWIGLLAIPAAWALNVWIGLTVGSVLELLSFSALMLALAFRGSFRAFQIRRRSLEPVKTWLENPSQWLF